MIEFTTTEHCISRAHCATCRDLMGGRQWRQKIRRQFRVPGDHVDWECPYGLPWQTPVGEGITIENGKKRKRIKLRKGPCAERKDPVCYYQERTGEYHGLKRCGAREVVICHHPQMDPEHDGIFMNGRKLLMGSCERECRMKSAEMSFSLVIPCAGDPPLTDQKGRVVEPSGLRATIASAVAGSEHLHEIIVVDDQADPPLSIDQPGVSLARTPKQLGVGRSRNLGAEQSSGAVVIWSDAHVRAEAGMLDRLAALAYAHRGLVCGSTLDWMCRHKHVGSGGQITRGNILCRQKMRFQRWSKTSGVHHVRAVLGGVYALWRPVWERLGPWLDTEREWGFSEEAYSLLAHFLGVPVLCAPDVQFSHWFFHKHPKGYRCPGKPFNGARSLYCLFGDDIWRGHIRSALGRFVNEQRMKKIESDPATQARRAQIAAQKVVSDHDVWAWLGGREPRLKASKPVSKGGETVVQEHRPKDVTVILLNWRRPGNIPAVLDSISAQSGIAPVIWLWNNGGEAIDDARIDLEVHASRNVGCWPRHLLAGMAHTEYIITMDDDLKPGDPAVFADALAALDASGDAPIVGAFGVNLLPGRSYLKSDHVGNRRQDVRVDILKNRFVAFRRSVLRGVPLDAWNESYEEDIALCGHVAGGARGRFLVPGILAGRLEEIDAGRVAVCKQPGHYERRDRVARQFFPGPEPTQPEPDQQPAAGVPETAAGQVRLNLGCGPKQRHKPGWVNIDIRQPADVIMDLTKGIDYAENTVDAIWADNLLEHFQADTDLVTVLNECHRVLKPGGAMTIIVPSVENHFEAAFGDPGHKTYFLPRLFEYWTVGQKRRTPWGERYGYKPWRQISLAHGRSITVVQQPAKDPYESAVSRTRPERTMEQIFSSVYEQKLWQHGSGSGSTEAYTRGYRAFLQSFMDEHGIQTIVDFGCGDWQFSKLIDWDGRQYVGLDVVGSLIARNQRLFAADHIRFEQVDFSATPGPPADLAIVKDVLNHWAADTIRSFLARLTTYPHVLIVGNEGHQPLGDTGKGYRPVDPSRPPFNLPVRPVFKFEDKVVWLLQGGGPQDALPPISLLTPTFGRVSKLRRVAACVQAQDYKGPITWYVLNDAPKPILCDLPGVIVENAAPGTFKTVGDKRRHLLEKAPSEICGWVDDDDLYRPNYVREAVSALQTKGVGCVQNRRAWYARGSRSQDFTITKEWSSLLEGNMVFRRSEALKHGIPSMDAGQLRPMLQGFKDARRHAYYVPADGMWTYIYCWQGDTVHLSGSSGRRKERFEFRNRDFGDGGPLTTAKLAPYWNAFKRDVGALRGAEQQETEASPATPPAAPVRGSGRHAAPRTAALIPAFNDVDTLPLCVRAIAPHVDEVCIWDDCSTDGTPDVLVNLSKELGNIQWRRGDQVQLGWCAARTKLMELTNATTLLFIDADDIFYTERAAELKRVFCDGYPHIQFGLLELWGDCRCGTGRGFRHPHHDKCHVLIDRGRVEIEWFVRNTFTHVRTPGAKPRRWETVLFAHAKGVKSDSRLVQRRYFREWMRSGMSRSFPDWFHMRSAESAPAELHAEALDHLFGSQVDPIRRLPDGVAAPSICAGNHRFEVLWDGDRPVDRVDRDKEPATAGQASA